MPDTFALHPLVPPLERIRRARTHLSLPASAFLLPPRRRAVALCVAEVEHARQEFWMLAHEFEIEHAFDRYLDAACHEGAALPHERAAGFVLLWLTHLQAEEAHIARSIAVGMLRSDRTYVKALFKRRADLKRGFKRAFDQYRHFRAAGLPIPLASGTPRAS